MRNKSENIIIILFALVLLIIIISIAFFNYSSSQTDSEIGEPTAIPPSPTPTIVIFPTALPQPNIPSVNYDNVAERSLLAKIENRKTLSPDDEKAKEKIINLPTQPGSAATIYETTNFRIEYNHTLNIFEVEIKTPDFNNAKREAGQWFLDQGLSQDAICNYPVEFYLNSQVANQLRDYNITFNTLAPDCK